MIPLQANTVLFEFKEGPYQQPTDKHFAPWAPQEGENSCAKLIQWLESARTGDTPPL